MKVDFAYTKKKKILLTVMIEEFRLGDRKKSGNFEKQVQSDLEY